MTRAPPEPEGLSYHYAVQTRSPQIEAPTPRSVGPSILAALRGWVNRPVVAVVAVGLIAGVLRFTYLGTPNQRLFDEIYYTKSACIYLGYSNARCDVTSDDEKYWRKDKNDTGAWVHPPLGKWAIALGQLALGNDPFGWRVPSAIFGTAAVVVLALIIQLLFGSVIWTFTGGLLLATENLSFVQSRVAMLDVFVAFWIALAFLFLLLDRRWMERRTPPAQDLDALEEAPPPPRVPSPLLRPWRIGAGLALGAAVATKWSGVTAIAGAVALSFMWEAVRRKRSGVRRPIWRTIQWESFPIGLFLLAVPALVYLASYLGWFQHFGFHLDDWLKLQQDMVGYHENLQTINPKTHEPTHPSMAQAWKWILLWRPVLYAAEYGKGVRWVIYANGNPAIFWGSLLAIPYVAYAWRRKRDWRAGFVAVAIAALYLPWFLVSRPQFFFYATPIVPFFVLACIYALKDLSEAHIAGSRSRPWLPVAVGFVVVSVYLFFFFWPVMTGGQLSDSAWSARAWFPSWV